MYRIVLKGEQLQAQTILHICFTQNAGLKFKLNIKIQMPYLD